ncbi:hypothetical protein [Streptomyces sp. NPDC046909]
MSKCTSRADLVSHLDELAVYRIVAGDLHPELFDPERWERPTDSDGQP